MSHSDSVCKSFGVAVLDLIAKHREDQSVFAASQHKQQLHSRMKHVIGIEVRFKQIICQGLVV